MAKQKRPSDGSARKKAEQESVDFERALADVESIVSKLESGELGLSDSLEQYEIGIKRLKQCHALLQQAERRVMLLSGVDSDGNPVKEPFRVDDRKQAAGGKRRRRKEATPPNGDLSSGSVDDLPGLF
jgi:exodeoxyribonuclease VII small subunit